MKVSYNDITSRIYSISAVHQNRDHLKPRIYTEDGMFCQDNALNGIKNWLSLAENTTDAFNYALDIFEEVCSNSSENTVKETNRVLVENIKKVRDADALQNSIKYRNSRIKTKISTKINNKMDNVTNAIKDSISKINHDLTNSPLTPTSALPPDRTKNDDDGDTEGVAESNRIRVAEDCFNKLLEEVTKCKECDRIVSNYNKVSKRFNLDRLVYETTYPNELYQSAFDIAKCMDTYDTSFRIKYSCALENAFYAFNKNHIQYPSDKIIEAVTDYFIFNGGLTESDCSDIVKTKDTAVLFDDDDFDSITYLIEEEPPEDNGDKELYDYEYNDDDMAESLVQDYDGYQSFAEANVGKKIKDSYDKFKSKRDETKKDVKQSAKKLIKDAKHGNKNERLDHGTQKMIDDFRKDCAKDPDNNNNLTRLKSLITGLFAKTPYQIVYDLPNLFSLIRAGFIITTIAINPILGAVATIADQTIRLTLSRKQTQKIINAYKAEIDTVKSKIEKAKDDDTKDRYNKYLKELEKDLDKLNEYMNNLHTEEENDERREAENNDDDDDFDDDEDWDLDDDDDDWDLDEAADIVVISDLMESINESLGADSLDDVITDDIPKLDNDCIDSVTDLACTIPNVIDKEKLCQTLINYRNELRESSRVTDLIRVDILNENIFKLKNSAYSYNTTNDMNGIMNYLSCLDELSKLHSSNNYIIEGMSFTNTIKLAIDRLKKAAVKLSDKEKQISSSIDVAASQVSSSMEKALMNDNRESIIKGSVIPSASKCIKTAITLGVAWAVSPAIAVIGALGAFACHKKLEKKERQMVMDEIDIELKMVDRYIKKAEDEDDMKKLQQLEMMQRDLQRQEQRIKYSMRVYHDKVPEVRETD